MAWRGRGQGSGPDRPVHLPCEATSALSEHLTFAEIDTIDPLLSSGALHADLWSDPHDESGYSAEDLLSLGFTASAPDARARQEVHRVSRRRPGLLTMRCSSSAGRARSPLWSATPHARDPAEPGRRTSLSPISSAIVDVFLVLSDADQQRRPVAAEPANTTVHPWCEQYLLEPTVVS